MSSLLCGVLVDKRCCDWAVCRVLCPVSLMSWPPEYKVFHTLICWTVRDIVKYITSVSVTKRLIDCWEMGCVVGGDEFYCYGDGVGMVINVPMSFCFWHSSGWIFSLVFPQCTTVHEIHSLVLLMKVTDDW